MVQPQNKVEERISELEDRAVEITQTQKRNEKEGQQSEDN